MRDDIPGILVIGASAAGLKAACRARRLLPDTPIRVLDERTFISYGACGLPFYLAGDVESLDHLRETAYGVVRDPDYFRDFKGIEVLTGMRATALDPVAHEVTAEPVAPDDADGGPRRFAYDQLLIATGASARLLPGVEIGPHVGCFHTPEDAKGLRQGLETGRIGTAIIVGAGFVGLETAVALGELWGCEVTLLEAAGRVLPQILDDDMAALLEAELKRKGVTVRCGMPVAKAVSTEAGAEVEAGGEVFRADRAVIAVGVEPRTGWATPKDPEAGPKVGPSGGLAVDEHLRTSLPDVYAAGDCIELIHRPSGKPLLLPQGSLANRQGRVVGDNLAGRDSNFGPVAAGTCLKAFDWNVAATGLSASAAERAGIECREAWVAAKDRVHFHPDRQNLYLKLTYAPDDRRLLGLQILGPGDAVKRADVFTALLNAGGTLDDLAEAETAYSPPYNTALDPLYVLGCAARNREDGGPEMIGPLDDGGDRLVIDVREPDELTDERSSPAGALHIPLGEIRARADEIPADRPLLLVCATGTRSFEAATFLATRGRDVVCLAGGINLRTELKAPEEGEDR